VFTEHDMDIVFGISEKIVVLQQGSVIADGAPAEIKANPQVRKAYLGEEIQE
jgi:branched-chain amino acid transport system ATP-binding protein